jgi:hypothetical protein
VLLEEFIPATFPSAAAMIQAGTSPSHYFDAVIAENWEALVTPSAAEYIAQYATDRA